MRLKRAKLSLALWAVLIPSALAPLSAHAQTGDAALNAANADLAPVGTVDPAAAAGQPVQPQAQAPVPAAAAVPSGQPETGGAQADAAAAAAGTSPSAQTYSQEDVLAKAENVFGKGAEGLAGLIEGIFRENGEPNGYIVGREAGGAFAIGMRSGSRKSVVSGKRVTVSVELVGRRLHQKKNNKH